MTPYFLQPHKARTFLSSKKQIWPTDITREYFLSFEDALWNLLPRLGYKKGSTFLVPELYCVDVINNIRDHGYNVFEYPVNPDLSVDVTRVMEVVAEIRPDVFIDFETVGIASEISRSIAKKLPFYTLIINDRVHSVISPTINNFPVSDRHLILTSFRKVTPFPGSVAIYTRNARKSLGKLPFVYTVHALGLWIRYITLLRISTLLKSTRLAQGAEKLLRKHDNLIGDAKESAPLPNIFFSLIDRINVTTIENSKKSHFKIYRSVLKECMHSDFIIPISGLANSARKLRGYPIIIQASIAKNFEKLCREKGFLTVSQLDECTWAKSQKLYLLPLGPHLSIKDVKIIANIAREALTRAVQYDTISA